MADNIGDLSITIRVNKQTGELEVLKGQVVDTGKAIEGLGQSSVGSAEQLTGLAGSITKLASATAVLAFLKTAIAEAAAEQEALRQLKAQMDALGLSFDFNRVRIENWTQAMAEAAHIEDDVVIGALGRTIQRTKDLDQAMKLVQLSQDIAIATGKNFESTLDMLSRAAGGAQRGLMMMRQEFGAQLAGVTSNEEALNRLGATYGGMSTKAASASLIFGDMWRQLKEAGETMVKGVLPAFQELVNVLGGPVMIVIKTVSVAVGQIVSMLVQEVASAAGGIRRLIEGVVEIAFNLFTGRLRGAKDAAVSLSSDLMQLLKDDLTKQGEIMAEGDRKLKEAWLGQKNAAKENLVELANFRAEESAKESQEAIEQMNQRLSELRRVEAQELSDKMLSEEEKIAIIQRYKQMEVDIILATRAQIGDAELNSIERITQLYSESENKIRQIKQQNLENWKQGLNSWVAYNTQVDARLVQIGKQAADQLANNFGAATAKMIMHGDSFTKTFEAMFRNLSEQVIGQIVAMIAKWAVLNAVTGGGVSFTKVLGLAEGGRVYNPTYALIGEGGEPESVVPDSKAKDFARGVLAGGGGGPAPMSMNSPSAQGGPGVTVVLNMGGVTLNVGAGVNGNDASNLAAQLIRGFNEETADYVRLAILSNDVAVKHAGRAV